MNSQHVDQPVTGCASELYWALPHPSSSITRGVQIGARQRASEAVFDNSRLVEFSEQIQYDAPAVQLTPLVQEGGRLVVTDQRLYFQPLHNVAGGNPVRSHPLAALAAVAHRHSSLRPVGGPSLHSLQLPVQ